MSEEEVAEHAFLGGRLTLREPRRGHRAGTDAVLLGAAAKLQPGQHLVDVGAGAGAAALVALCHAEGATAMLVERDPRMADLARHNIAINGFADRASVAEIDLFDAIACRGALARAGDVVISNPPFYLEGTVRASPKPQQAASHVLVGADHADWCRRVLALTAARGRMMIIHRPEALPDLVTATTGRAGLRVTPVHARTGEDAVRIVIEAQIGRNTPLRLGAPLVLHGDDGRFLPWAEALHRGQAMLP